MCVSKFLSIPVSFTQKLEMDCEAQVIRLLFHNLNGDDQAGLSDGGRWNSDNPDDIRGLMPRVCKGASISRAVFRYLNSSDPRISITANSTKSAR
jgi:hypothetical protein